LQEAVERHKADSVELVLVSLDFKTYYPNKILEFIKEKNLRLRSSGWMKRMPIIFARALIRNGMAQYR